MQLNECASYVLAVLEGFLVYLPFFGMLARWISWSELPPDYRKEEKINWFENNWESLFHQQFQAAEAELKSEADCSASCMLCLQVRMNSLLRWLQGGRTLRWPKLPPMALLLLKSTPKGLIQLLILSLARSFTDDDGSVRHGKSSPCSGGILNAVFENISEISTAEATGIWENWKFANVLQCCAEYFLHVSYWFQH